MRDLNQELRKLDPSKLVDRLHPAVKITSWESCFPVDKARLSEQFKVMMKTTKCLPFEVISGDTTYWLLVPMQTQQDVQRSLGIGMMIDDGNFGEHHYIDGTMLPVNTALIPEGIIGIVGDFFLRED